MMNLEEFAENIIRDISNRTEGALHILKKNVVRNNNVKMTGITVVKEGSGIEPCVYLEEFFREYKSGGMKFDEVVDEVYRLIMKNKDDIPKVDVSFFLNWETVRDNIYAKLISAEQNKEQLGEMPHRIFLDLAVVYYAVARDSVGKEIGTVLIRNEHMEEWEQREEILYQTAMTNMRAEGEAELATIETVIKSIFPDNNLFLDDGGIQRNTGMYIRTNRHNRFGAAEILDKNTLRRVADQMGDGFLVIPSSVHETIVLPPRDEEEYRQLAEMVREVNDTQVDIEERLSYHVYMYSRDEEALKIAA